MNKPFKLIAAVLIMALAAFLFVGCGGGGEEDNAPPKKSKTNADASAAAATPTDMPEALIGQAIVPTKDSPEDFTKAIDDQMPIVVTFYMPAPYDDSQVRSSIMTLQGRYRGQVEFFDYLYSDAQSYKDLVTLLKVNSTPTVVIINRQGVVQRAWTGFVDADSIEQGISETLAPVSG